MWRVVSCVVALAVGCFFLMCEDDMMVWLFVSIMLSLFCLVSLVFVCGLVVVFVSLCSLYSPSLFLYVLFLLLWSLVYSWT